MIFLALPSFRPIVFGYDRLSNAILMTCQLEAEGRELAAALGEISKLLEAHQPCRLLMDLKQLVGWDEPTLTSTLHEWLPAVQAQAMDIIALVPPRNKTAAAAADRFTAAARRQGIRVMSFSAIERAHQWLMQH